MTEAKHARNFKFSNSDKTRECKDILTVEGPVVTIRVTVEIMSTALFNPYRTNVENRVSS